jgi:5-methylthioadenosine/S-adenosylhomocysteine deaminase
MIKSGTTFANDMYFHADEIVRAFDDSGMRAAVGLALFDFDDPDRRVTEQRTAESLLARLEHAIPRQGDTAGTPRVFLTVSPHAIYTCSAELLTWASDLAAERALAYHIHMSETTDEVEETRRRTGSSPFGYLESLGVFEKNEGRVLAAHGVWVDDDDLEIARKRGVTVAHNPASNMKLASGALPYAAYRRHEVPMMLAPDGVASNNSLDMFDEMKLAALLQKHATGDATSLPASEILSIAWGGRGRAFSTFGVSGELVPGAPADIAILDLDHPRIVPIHRLESNLVYAAAGSVVDTVICDGEIVMRNRRVRDEEIVIREARRCASALIDRTTGA